MIKVMGEYSDLQLSAFYSYYVKEASGWPSSADIVIARRIPSGL